MKYSVNNILACISGHKCLFSHCVFFFSPSFLFTIVDLSPCEMETSSSGSLAFFPAYLRLSEVFRRAPLLALELSENIS